MVLIFLPNNLAMGFCVVHIVSFLESIITFICSVDKAKEKEGDDSLTVIRSDKGIRVINGENITETGKYGYVHVKSESLVKATLIGAVTGYVIGAVVGFVVGVCTLNPLVGVTAGSAMGGYAAAHMISNNYNPDLNTRTVYKTVIGVSAVAGVIGGAFGGYVAIEGFFEQISYMLLDMETYGEIPGFSLYSEYTMVEIP